MILAADVGNTNTVFGLWSEPQGALIETLRLSTDPKRTSDDWFLTLSQWIRLANPDRHHFSAVYCSVAPGMNSALTVAFKKLGCESILNVDAKSANLNFEFNYPAPATIGADRIANLIAGSNDYGKNLIIVDFGTAITFCVLTNNIFQGGVIAPGIFSSLDALFVSTAKLPQIAFRNPNHAIGKTTVESIEIGSYLGWRGLIREILREIKRELAGAGAAGHKVIATGGISETLDFAHEFFDIIDRDLTLKGLYLAATRRLCEKSH